MWRSWLTGTARGHTLRETFKLAYWDDVVESKDGQWVYPARGLAVFTTLADTEIARVVAFHPTTIAIYRARLARGAEPPRELDAH